MLHRLTQHMSPCKARHIAWWRLTAAAWICPATNTSSIEERTCVETRAAHSLVRSWFRRSECAQHTHLIRAKTSAVVSGVSQACVFVQSGTCPQSAAKMAHMASIAIAIAIAKQTLIRNHAGPHLLEAMVWRLPFCVSAWAVGRVAAQTPLVMVCAP